MSPASSSKGTMGADVVKLTAVGFVMLLLVVGTSVWGFSRLTRATQLITEVTRNQMDADMMHDALRADVLASLLARSADDATAATTDLREHADRFRSSLDANQKLALSPKITETESAMAPRLASYLRSADELVATAATDRAAAARQLPRFVGEFEELEKSMSNLSDEIEAFAVESQADAQGFLQWLLVGIGVLSSGLLGAIGLSLFRSVRAKERTEREAQQKLAEMTKRELEQAQRLREHVQTLLSAVEAAAHGDLTRDVTIPDDGVVGQMATGLRAFLTDLRSSMSMLAVHAATLGRASEDLSGVSGRMSGSASEAAMQANNCTTASQVVSASVETVASGTAEMTSSIQEIARSASEATRVAAEAVAVAGDANQIVLQFGSSSTEVGKVVMLITQIASQTKMLALNATIEAARAGEAGRGFAVVANEVSELAKRTASATSDISVRIETIQRDTGSAVSNIERVVQIINRINALQLSIAGAIEEQTATTNEMSRTVMEGARGANEISRSIAGVARAAGDTSTNATHSAAASRELAAMAVELRSLVDRYRLTPSVEVAVVPGQRTRPHTLVA